MVGNIVEQTEEDTDDERRSHTLVGVERSADNRREHQGAPLVLLLHGAEQTEEVELLIERVQQRVNNRDLGERRKLWEYREQVDVAQTLRREVVVAVVKNQIQNVRAETHDDEEHQVLRDNLPVQLELDLLKVKVPDKEVDEDNRQHGRLIPQVTGVGGTLGCHICCCLRDLRCSFRDRCRSRLNGRFQGREVHLRGDDNKLPEENQGDDDDIKPSEVFCLLSREDNVAYIHAKLPPL